VIPQVIHFGNESYLEGVDINNETFLHKLKMSAELPKTSAPPPEMFVKMFSDLTAEAQTILCIHPSAVVSGTVRSATIAAAEFPQADIRVLDNGWLPVQSLYWCSWQHNGSKMGLTRIPSNHASANWQFPPGFISWYQHWITWQRETASAVPRRY